MTKKTCRPHLELLVTNSGPDAPFEEWSRWTLYHIADSRAKRNNQWVSEILVAFRDAVRIYAHTRIDYLEEETSYVRGDGETKTRTKLVNRVTVLGPVPKNESWEPELSDDEDYYTIKMRFPRTDQYPRSENPDWPELVLPSAKSTEEPTESDKAEVKGDGDEGSLVVTADGEVKLEGASSQLGSGDTVTAVDSFGNPIEIQIL